jgi:hypothetical protein
VTAPLKVGSPLWRFDINRRVYAKDDKGRTVGGPIWREHWTPREVVGETRVSWLVGFSGDGPGRVSVKVAKKDFAAGGCPQGWATSQEHIDRLAWIVRNRGRLSTAVSRCNDYDALQKVAALVGYEVKP